MNLSLFLTLFQIAVLLIDCQGTGDNLQSDTKFDTQIMFLSVEMSTYQILNATKNVTSTDLLGLKVKKVWVNFRYTWVIRHFFYHCLPGRQAKLTQILFSGWMIYYHYLCLSVLQDNWSKMPIFSRMSNIFSLLGIIFSLMGIIFFTMGIIYAHRGTI